MENYETIEAIEERKAQIAVELETADEARIDELNSEVDALEARKAEINAAIEQRKLDMQNVISEKDGEKIIIEEKKSMGIEEIRNSKEYINAYANYIKSGKDEEVRALLTTNTTYSGNYVPVPEIVDEIIHTAWDKVEIMNLVKKTFIRGNLKVGFELSADGALVHVEGANANNEEALVLGIVELKPESIKKWITISDEALDLAGEAFLRYIYAEITYRIAKKAQELLLAKITALTASATSTAVSVGIVDGGAPTLNIVSECLGTLSDEASNPVIVMNKATYPQFIAAQTAASYYFDPFMGLPVYFDSTIPTYSTAATTGNWLIVGDFGRGAQANFPAGQEISLKFDDLSLAEKDLVKIVGREYVGLGIVSDKCFCKVTMHT